MVRANPVVIVHKLRNQAIVWLYPVALRRAICTVSPLFTVQVIPTFCPLMIRCPVAVFGNKVNSASIVVLIVAAVYTLVVYRVSSSIVPVKEKYTPSGVSSRSANTSAMCLLESYCKGRICRIHQERYLFGILCL